MLQFILKEQRKRKNIIVLFLLFLGLISLYTFLDNYGLQSYKMLGDAFGYQRVVMTILLNVFISLLSAFTISITLINFKINNKLSSGSLFASIGNVLALLFTGCAACGVTLLSSITLSLGFPIVAPGAIKYKFLALLIIALGLIVAMYVINTSTCSIKKGGNKNESKNSIN